MWGVTSGRRGMWGVTSGPRCHQRRHRERVAVRCIIPRSLVGVRVRVRVRVRVGVRVGVKG